MAKEPTAQALEAALAQHPAIERAAVVADTDPRTFEKQWRAYIVPRSTSETSARQLKFSLFYFADANSVFKDNKYRLYVDGAKFADAHGFEAVWTPERHFHENGGLYPNPAVLSAALAAITSRVKLRAGSVVLPLHNPFRVAEEWSIVDNLSQGRIGLSFASGWIPNDFAIAPQPESFKDKREVMLSRLDQVQQLWEGRTLAARDGLGNDVQLRIFPPPIQPRLPIWLTCSGDPVTFAKAGERGFNVLTALLIQSVEETVEKVAIYRKALAENGHDPASGQVTLMIHTFVGADEQTARQRVEGPLKEYLKSHISLIETMVKSLHVNLDDIDLNDPKWSDYLVTSAFERYYQTASLIGSPSRCLKIVEQIRQMGVDEIACLIDFGVETDCVLEGLHYLNELKEMSQAMPGPSRAALLRWLEERELDDVGPVCFTEVADLPADLTPSIPDERQRQAKWLAAPADDQADALPSVAERVSMQRAAMQWRHHYLRNRSEKP